MEAYRPQSSDTSAEADRERFRRYAQMTPAQKMQLLGELQREADELALIGIRRRHPHADERERSLRLLALKVDRGLMVRAFGWDPAVEGY